MPTKKFLDMQGLSLYDSKIKEWTVDKITTLSPSPEVVTEEELTKILNSPAVLNYDLGVTEDYDEDAGLINFSGYIAFDNSNGTFGPDPEAYLFIRTYSTANEEVIYKFLTADLSTIDVSEFDESDWAEADWNGYDLTITTDALEEDGTSTVHPCRIESDDFVVFAKILVAAGR